MFVFLRTVIFGAFIVVLGEGLGAYAQSLTPDPDLSTLSDSFPGALPSPTVAPPSATVTPSTSPVSAFLPPSGAGQPISPFVAKTETPKTGVDWFGLTKDSVRFLVVMQAFRCATEQGTRQAFSTPFFKGWFTAVGNMHGFADGDPFMVNYIGHPMQGAVSGAIWSNNDRAYKDVYFSSDKRYWKEKLRGAAFAYVYSVQFEIGPISEASLGNVQSYYPAQGFVDHVVTPVVGTGWSIGEDVIDRYLIVPIEMRSTGRWPKIFARSFLNPARTFANMMSADYPWYRNNRPGVTAYESASYYNTPAIQKPNPPPGVAPFEFHAVAIAKTYMGANSLGSCIGGGAGVGIRLADEWQLVTDVNGCKMTNLATNFSGDSLTYQIGPRWVSQRSQRLIPHAQFLVGGNKITQEYLDPEKKRLWDLAKAGKHFFPPPYSAFAVSWDSNAVALTTGAGVDWKFNNALMLRTALDYQRTWNGNINDISYRNSLQLTSGIVLNMGTW